MVKTYISLFSSAGVGCFGFKQEGFECIATNELLEKRLNIQKINDKCKYESGYICGDITTLETQKLILDEIEYWKNNEELSKVDVIMATPPCQGMSTANYKKSNELNRNSLVVEAIHLIKNIKPRVFIFENVRAFLTTNCVDKDKEYNTIEHCINKHLSENYNIFHKVVNFMDYGIPSSRPRTLVIGTLKEELNFSPLNIFPLKKKKITVKDVIGNLKSLNYGEIDKTDLYHSFRKYPRYMLSWIHNLKEGETAFDNEMKNLPYKIVNGKKQILKAGHMGNKFCRMFWNKPAPCITTRNDQLASQSTIHPKDDRVLSIRELMRVMSIPDEFKWVENATAENINKNETLIRQSIGEAVPTNIIRQIAHNISDMLEFDSFVRNYEDAKRVKNIKNERNPYILSFLYEKNLSNTKETGSFYTPQSVVYNTIKEFKNPNKIISVLEPSVGVGSFIPQFLRLVDDKEQVYFDLVDISSESITQLKKIIKKFDLDEKFIFKYIHDDFITHKFDKKYDVIISNPPYFKMTALQKRKYKEFTKIRCENIFCIFLEKYTKLSNEILCVIPKTFLMTPDSNDIRDIMQRNYRVKCIYDYGVHLFKDVFIEIISIVFTKERINKTYIENRQLGIFKEIPFDYIYHDKMWLIYRDKWFDNYIKTLKLNIFDFYRDRQLTNKYLKSKGKIWVLKSKNLLDNGSFIHKKGYDKFVDSLDGFNLSKYSLENSIVFTNFTYNTRASYLPKNCTVNGSFCVFFKKNDLQNIDLSLYSTKDFRKYYGIIKNLSKFTINVDSNSIYYIGAKND